MASNHLQYVKPITYITNLVCSMLIGLILMHSAFKLWKNKKIQKQISYTALSMFISSTFALLWKITGVFIANCDFYQVVVVAIFAIIRISYYLFLTYRLEISFSNSVLKLNKKMLTILRCIFVIATLLLATWNIATLKTVLQINVPPFGIYCEIEYPAIVPLAYGAYDIIVSASMLIVFVSKLYKFSKWVDAGVDSRANSETQKILTMIRIVTYLTIISIVSTWFFIVVGNSILQPLTWVSAIDYLLNVLCIYLMFKFVHLRERLIIASDINCYGSKYCCWCWCCYPCNHICWKEPIRDEMNKFHLLKRGKTIEMSSTTKSTKSHMHMAVVSGTAASSTSPRSVDSVNSDQINT